MSATTTVAPTRASTLKLRDCKTLQDAFGSPEFLDRIKQSVPTHVNSQRMLRTFVQATSRAPLLLKCSMRSVLGAMLTCSEVGLEPNTPLQHAFLIPFGRYKWNKETRERELQGYEVQLIFGYPGLLDLSYRSGQVVSVHADVAWKADDFSFAYGTDSHLRHTPKGVHAPEEMPVWAYAHAMLKNGQAFEAMPWADVLRIRNGSQGYQSALASKQAAESKGWKLPASWTEAPWVKHEIAMARKTAFRSLSKWLPKSVELAGALALDEAQDRGTIDFGAVIDGEASIMDGNLTETESMFDDDPKDATAAFGTRGAPTVEGEPVKQSDPPPKQEQAPPAPTPTPAPTPAPAKPRAERAKKTDAPKQEPTATAASTAQLPLGEVAPVAQKIHEKSGIAQNASPGAEPFAAWLVTADGEPIDQEDGSPGKFTSPVAYARALRDALDAEFPADREAMMQANADDAAIACSLSAEATAILYPVEETPGTDHGDGMPEEVPPADEAGNPVSVGEAMPNRWQVRPPNAGSKAEWERFNRDLVLLLQSAVVPDTLNAIVDANSGVYNEFPPKYRVEAKAAVSNRMAAISKVPPPAAAEPGGSYYRAMADDFIGLIQACATLADLRGLETKADLVRTLATLNRDAPEDASRVKAAAKARMAALS